MFKVDIPDVRSSIKEVQCSAQIFINSTTPGMSLSLHIENHTHES